MGKRAESVDQCEWMDQPSYMEYEAEQPLSRINGWVWTKITGAPQMSTGTCFVLNLCRRFESSVQFRLAALSAGGYSIDAYRKKW